MIGEKQKHGNLAGIILWSKSFTLFIMNALSSTHSASLHSGRLTRDKRKNARLAFFPNFAPFHSAKLFLSRNVVRNCFGRA